MTDFGELALEGLGPAGKTLSAPTLLPQIIINTRPEGRGLGRLVPAHFLILIIPTDCDLSR